MMAGILGGFITIIVYSSFDEANEESQSLITENGTANIWTETNSDILV